MFLEDKIEALRKRIDVELIQYKRETNAFSISFSGEEPQLVARIATSLASYFINENLKAREEQAIGTSDFLESELETMRQRLEEVEDKLKKYRERNMGELPEQLHTNLSILNRLQDRLVDRLRRAAPDPGVVRERRKDFEGVTDEDFVVNVFVHRGEVDAAPLDTVDATRPLVRALESTLGTVDFEQVDVLEMHTSEVTVLTHTDSDIQHRAGARLLEKGYDG